MPGAVMQAAQAVMMAQQLDPALPPKEVLAALDTPVRRLVAVVKTLYAGSWDDCAEDIRRRRAGRPYLFKLSLGSTTSSTGCTACGPTRRRAARHSPSTTSSHAT